MTSYRFVIERTTFERAEIEVDAETFEHAATIAAAFPLKSTDQRRRRLSITKSFDEDTRRTIAHEIISGKEVR